MKANQQSAGFIDRQPLLERRQTLESAYMLLEILSTTQRFDHLVYRKKGKIHLPKELEPDCFAYPGKQATLPGRRIT
jgi:hypothetical protein